MLRACRYRLDPFVLACLNFKANLEFQTGMQSNVILYLLCKRFNVSNQMFYNMLEFHLNSSLTTKKKVNNLIPHKSCNRLKVIVLPR
jgi:hypothetical protein